MSDGDTARNDIGWREIWAELWFFPALFFALFGASIPIISLIRAVAVDHQFIAPVHEFISAYNSGARELTYLLERPLLPLISWLNQSFHWRLLLAHRWFDALVLCSALLIATARVGLKEGRLVGVIVFLTFGGALVVLSCVLAGLMPEKGPWWVQASVAGLPALALYLAFWVPSAVNQVVIGEERALQELLGSALIDLVTAVVITILGTMLAAASILESGAGIASLAAMVLGIATRCLWQGLRKHSAALTRVGLTMSGGFLSAAMVLAVQRLG